MLVKEFVWPTLIVPTSGASFPLRPHSEYRANPSAHPAVKIAEYVLPAVLEVVEPASQAWIELGDDGVQTVSVRPLRDLPDFVLEFVETLLAGPSSPLLETVAEELETVPGLGVHDTGLLRGEFEPRLFHPTSYGFKRRLRFLSRPAKDDEIVGVPDRLEPLRLHEVVERVQVDVGEYRTEYATNAINNFEFAVDVRYERKFSKYCAKRWKNRQ